MNEDELEWDERSLNYITRSPQDPAPWDQVGPSTAPMEVLTVDKLAELHKMLRTPEPVSAPEPEPALLVIPEPVSVVTRTQVRRARQQRRRKMTKVYGALAGVGCIALYVLGLLLWIRF